jgi:hypothetical protein
VLPPSDLRRQDVFGSPDRLEFHPIFHLRAPFAPDFIIVSGE